MKRIVYMLLVSVVLLLVWQDDCIAQRKNKKKKNVPQTETKQSTPKKESDYDRLFKGKQVQTAKGLMTIHMVNDRGRDLVYAEFPVSLLGKDMMLTSAIREISDAGEGVVGQFNNFIYLRFTRLESNLMARIIPGDEPSNIGTEENVTRSLEQNTNPGIWQSMKIMAYTPDSSAMVVDITKILVDHSDYTSPFAAFGGNSMGGFTQRQHQFRSNMTRLLGVNAFDNNVVVTGEYSYSVNHTFMGTQTYRKDVAVTVTADRILLLLPEDVMRPRFADTRVGTVNLKKRVLGDLKEGFKEIRYTTRWRLEPSDEAAFRAGELVEPKKPIVFYMDTLIPSDWKKAIKDGFEAWNKAFETAGFKNVVRVIEFPKNDPEFSAININNSVIRYSPMWLEFAQNSSHIDMRSGEILNASVMLHGGVLGNLERMYKTAVMASDPGARTNGRLPEKTQYELIKSYMTQVAGSCLGVIENAKCEGAFAVDSLRSPSFTQKYGIAPSVMMSFQMYNIVAQEEDVLKGVRLIPTGPGEYDCYAINWLYRPIYGVASPAEEEPVLNEWIAKEKGNRNCAFGYGNRLIFDPSAAPALLGDDHIKMMNYYLKNLKYACEHLCEWYAENDKDYTKRSTYASLLINSLDFKFRFLASHFGGMYVNYDEKEGVTFDFESRKEEKRYIDYFFTLMEEVSSLKVKGLEGNAEISNDPTNMLVWGIFSQMFAKIEYMYFMGEKSKDTYTAEEFVEELNRRVWAPTREGRVLSMVERSRQNIMVGLMSASTGLLPDPRRNAAGGGAGQRQLADGSLYYHISPEVLNRVDCTINREAENMDEHNIYFPIITDLGATREPVQHIYFSMLLKTKDLIKQAIPRSSGETRKHYEFLLYKIDDVLSVK
ncbi:MULTISPECIES: zinc-dependent metalloprotease [unclassified Butyricimonas]|uniref:DUF5117 and DUF5118 domain-containing protein n=1 Tax=unclassified Butyricimonas TaxID=2637652 RepID=UPI0013A62879|nr:MULTISPECIES: zinc-dependent metalloprotease [unclassified Butyricimonas]